jgi:hypothetical protein
METQTVPESQSDRIVVPNVNRRGKKKAAGPQLLQKITSEIPANAATAIPFPVVGNLSASLPAPAPKVDAAVIDRAGKVDAILADYAIQVKPFQIEADVLEKKILAALETLPASDIHTDEGDLYRLQASAKAEQQKIVEGGLAKVLNWLGQDVFLRVAAITLKSLEALLTPEQYKEIVIKERTGRRTLKVVPKVAPQPLKAA